MRKFQAGFAALVMLAGVSACSQGSGAEGPLDLDPKAIEAHVAKLASETFKGAATAAVDLTGMRDALPKEVALTWGNLSFEAATGATLLTDVKLTPADMPQVGVGIAELRLWDFNADLVTARLKGERLAEAGKLAKRIDAKNVALFGMADMMNSMMSMGAPMDMQLGPPMTPEAVPGNPTRFAPQQPTPPDEPLPGDLPNMRDWPSVTEPELQFDPSQYPGMMGVPKFERYDVSYGRFILDDVQLKPFVVKAAPADAPPEMAGIQQLLAVARSFGVDTMAGMDMKLDLAMEQMGEKMGGSYTVKTMGARGMRGGDLDAMFTRDLSYSFDLPAISGAPQKLEMTMGFFSLKDMRLDKLYDVIGSGEPPPTTMTDVMGIGLWRTENTTLKMGGKDLVTTAESTLDARKWHWLIPTDLQASARGMTIDLEAFVGIAEQFAALEGEFMPSPDMDPVDPEMVAPEGGMTEIDEIAQFKAVIDILKKHGLAKPSLNMNFGWNYDPAAGGSRLAMGFGGDGLIDIAAKYEGMFPDFKSAAALAPAGFDDPNADKLAALFEAKTMLKLVDINLADKGGLEKMFNVAAELAPVMAGPDMSGMMDGQTGASLRQMASGLLQTFGASPEIAPFAMPFAKFIAEGGKLHLGLAPAQPMTFDALAQKFMGGGESPAEVFKELGLKVEHSK